ncbi:MAG: hypothetical protein EAZ55_10230 [Cytophagales bacterium]|nr:MAG: hypothetical protein EAZ55_10230 [Cytophagales bacterium]
MAKKSLIILFIIGLIIIVIWVGSTLIPKKQNFVWKPTYEKDDEQPLGAYLVHQRLNDLFSKEVKTNDLPFAQLYQSWEKNKQMNLAKTNYIAISKYFFMDSVDVKVFLRYLNAGGKAFIAADGFSDTFLEALYLSTKPNNNIDDQKIYFEGTKTKKMGKIEYQIPTYSHTFQCKIPKYSHQIAYFTSKQTSKYVINPLGYSTNKRPVFIHLKVGKGDLYLSTTAILFTNYHLLRKPNEQWIEQSLSFLDKNNTTYWDEHYKKIIGKRESPPNPLAFILSNPSLRNAFYTLIVALLLWTIFAGKRLQNAIPIITPLQNTTLEFIHTISHLYLKQKQHHHMAQKKIQYFLDHIRQHYYLSTQEINEQFYEALATKSNNSIVFVKKIFATIKEMEKKEQISPEELIALNKNIEFFKNNKKKI